MCGCVTHFGKQCFACVWQRGTVSRSGAEPEGCRDVYSAQMLAAGVSTQLNPFLRTGRSCVRFGYPSHSPCGAPRPGLSEDAKHSNFPAVSLKLPKGRRHFRNLPPFVFLFFLRADGLHATASVSLWPRSSARTMGCKLLGSLRGA